MRRPWRIWSWTVARMKMSRCYKRRTSPPSSNQYPAATRHLSTTSFSLTSLVSNSCTNWEKVRPKRKIIVFSLSFYWRSGGFGNVRACKFRKGDLRGISPVSSTTTAASSEGADSDMQSQEEEKKGQAAEMSKFARTKTQLAKPPRAKNSTTALDEINAFER